MDGTKLHLTIPRVISENREEENWAKWKSNGPRLVPRHSRKMGKWRRTFKENCILPENHPEDSEEKTEDIVDEMKPGARISI